MMRTPPTAEDSAAFVLRLSEEDLARLFVHRCVIAWRDGETALDGRSRAKFVHPSRHVGILGDVDPYPLVAREPWQVGDIRDRVFVTREVTSLVEATVEHP